MREIVVTAAMLVLEALVLVHWFLLPESRPLFVLALVAGLAMCAMAVADLALLVGVLRRDARDRQHRAELADLAHIEPLWAAVTVFQVAFIASAYVAGVYWIAVMLTLGQGAELLAVAWARLRLHHTPGPRPQAVG